MGIITPFIDIGRFETSSFSSKIMLPSNWKLFADFSVIAVLFFSIFVVSIFAIRSTNMSRAYELIAFLYVILSIFFGFIYYQMEIAALEQNWKAALEGIHRPEGCVQLADIYLIMVDCLYFSVITITTLGYGDITPQYWLAKIFTCIEVLIGLGLLVFALGLHWTERKSVSRQSETGSIEDDSFTKSEE